MSSCIAIEFHRNVGFFLALVGQTGEEGLQHLRSHHNQTTLRYNIRQCLRNIQEQLNHESFDLQTLYESSLDHPNDIPFRSTETIDGSNDQNGGTGIVHYDQVVDDLLSLLMTDYDMGGTTLPNSQSYEISVKNRVTVLLATAPDLSPTALCTVLNRLLRLMDHQEGRGDGNLQHDSTQFLDVFTSHVTGYPQLQPLQLTENDVFVGLHIALAYYERICTIPSHDESVSPPPARLALFIQSLIGYLAFVCLGPLNHGQIIHLDDWLHQRFLEQHGSESSSENLRRATDAYIERIEQYGMSVIDFAVQLSEKATESSSYIDQEEAHSFDERPRQDNFSVSQMKTKGGDTVDHVTILQYASLATTFLVAMKEMRFSPIPSGTVWGLESVGRTLWREFSKTVVNYFTNSPISSYVDDDTFTATPRTTAHGVPVGMNISASATDILWTLAKLHYPDGTSHSTSGQRGDIPLLVTTILSLWKDAEYMWEESVERWIHYLVQFVFPQGTLGGKELRQPLQALILSSLYFPAPEGSDGSIARRKAIDSLEKLLLVVNPGTQLISDTEDRDPWKIWILDQFRSDHTDTLC